MHYFNAQMFLCATFSTDFLDFYYDYDHCPHYFQIVTTHYTRECDLIYAH
jgi:hypothetical protein